uniref:Testis-expressed sequence 12 protein n=1 Tax=Scophthalmus maximus TaxID=52904 RepID=A0A8D3C0N4_SCOMX
MFVYVRSRVSRAPSTGGDVPAAAFTDHGKVGTVASLPPELQNVRLPSYESKLRCITMKEASPVAGKPTPPASSKRSANNKGASKQSTCQEMERSHENPDKSPPKKRRPPSTPSASESPDSFEATTAGASKEVSMLMLQFAEVLSERAAADTAQMKELEGILTKARNLESYLKEKKYNLRQTLAGISDKLQG